MAETIGTLVDKISITELKLYHMNLQVERADATPEHREMCAKRAAVISQQAEDLKAEATELLAAVIAGKKTIKVYRQFKMYNDPSYRDRSTK